MIVLVAISRNPMLVVPLCAVALPELRRTWAHPVGRALLRL